MTRYAVTYRTPAGKLCEVNYDSMSVRELAIITLEGAGAVVVKRYEFAERELEEAR